MGALMHPPFLKNSDYCQLSGLCFDCVVDLWNNLKSCFFKHHPDVPTEAQQLIHSFNPFISGRCSRYKVVKGLSVMFWSQIDGDTRGGEAKAVRKKQKGWKDFSHLFATSLPKGHMLRNPFAKQMFLYTSCISTCGSAFSYSCYQSGPGKQWVDGSYHHWIFRRL